MRHFEKKSHTIFYGTFFMGLFIILDQGIKWLVLQSETVDHLCNYGIAMGIVLPQQLFIVFWGILIVAVIHFWLKHLSENFLVQLPYILILSGGLSNMIDRVYYGCVVDYIPFLNISSFNVADVFITIGAVLILWQNFKSSKN